MGSACAHHTRNLTKCSESGQPKPKVIPPFPSSEKLTDSTWCEGELLRQTPQWCVCSCFCKNMSVCRAAQKHRAFSRQKRKESELGFPLLPGKEAIKQNQTQKTSQQGLSQGNHFTLFSWDKEVFPSTQHLPFIWLVVFGYLFLPWFPCDFGGQGMWKYLRNSHPLLTAKESSPMSEMCPEFTHGGWRNTSSPYNPQLTRRQMHGFGKITPWSHFPV